MQCLLCFPGKYPLFYDNLFVCNLFKTALDMCRANQYNCASLDSLARQVEIHLSLEKMRLEQLYGDNQSVSA